MSFPRFAYAGSEASLPVSYWQTYLPHVERGERRSFEGLGGKKIAYVAARTTIARGAIVLVGGYSESYVKYAELIFELNQAGFHVYAMDLRGMGRSERLAEDPMMAYVDDASLYGADLKKFIVSKVKKEWQGPVFLLAHSTGALPVARVLAEDPKLVSKAALTSPLFKLKTSPLPASLAGLIAQVASSVGLSKTYVIGKKPYDPSQDRPEDSSVTHSTLRAKTMLELFKTMPQTYLKGASFGWIHAISDETKTLKERAARIEAQLLILRAEEDYFVDREAQSEICRLIRNCNIEDILGAKHEILQEIDGIRGPSLNKIIRFFSMNP